SLSEHELAREARARRVRAQGTGDLDHMRRRRHVVERQLTDLRNVVEHRRQLAGHRLDLLVAQGQAREARYVQYLVMLDHGPGFYAPPPGLRRSARSCR